MLEYVRFIVLLLTQFSQILLIIYFQRIDRIQQKEGWQVGKRVRTSI